LAKGQIITKTQRICLNFFKFFSVVKHFTSESQFKMIEAAFSITPRCGYKILKFVPHFEKKNSPSFFLAAKFGVLLA
jgi:hypothetical protein